ncbi:MAG: hypothetical protein ACK55I_48470, partial [bacterium]
MAYSGVLGGELTQRNSCQPRQRADNTRNSGWNMRINHCRPYGPRNICAERDIVGVFRHLTPTGSGTS